MSTSPVVVVRAGQADVPAAADLSRRWLPAAELIDVLAAPDSWPLDEDDVLLLAKDQDTAIGFLFGTAPHRDQHAGQVWALAVAAAYRRQGVGRSLVREYALLAEQAGTDVVWIDPADGPDELALTRYYTRLGWQDQSGLAEGCVEIRQEFLYGTVASILAASAGAQRPEP